MKIDSKNLYTLIIPTILYIFHIFLNIIEFKYLKFFYLFEVVFFLSNILRFKLKDNIFTIFYFLFIEGQGRILWSYHPFARIVFDFTLVGIILKSVINQRFKVSINDIPASFIIFTGLHFAWYFVHLFNFISPTFIGVVAASKIYIFPFLLFFFFVNNLKDFDDEAFIKMRTVCMIIIFSQVILTFYQFSLREDHLMNITTYYAKTLRNTFVGVLFRPYGTIHIPGALSVYFAYSIGFCFITKFSKRIYSFFPILIMFLSFSSSLIMQVRSAILKEAAILVMFSLITLVATKGKADLIKQIFVNFFLSFVIIFIANKTFLKHVDFSTLEHSFRRLEQITDVRVAAQQRSDWGTAIKTIGKKLSMTPFGLGPGSTGAANSLSIQQIKNDPKYNISYIWTHDNLFISLAIDFGWGMFFYMGAIFSIVFYLIRKTIYYSFTQKASKILIMATATTFILLLGNWGAVGLPYNPESFFFWIWCALGVIEVQKIENKSSKEELTNGTI